jgi:hypothetical protein
LMRFSTRLTLFAEPASICARELTRWSYDATSKSRKLRFEAICGSLRC